MMPSRERGLWRDLPRAERSALRAFFRALRAKYGPFRHDRVLFEQARLVTELWFTGAQASGAALEEIVKRRHGRGRRPSLQALDRRLKRQGLGVTTYEAALRRLEELARTNGHGGRPFDLAAELARQGMQP